MPIQLPDLDNKTFAELMDEMTASIPKYTNEWTNFNPSDPGMAILELLAWISESLIYRANRVSEDANLNFLRLVAGDWSSTIRTRLIRESTSTFRISMLIARLVSGSLTWRQ